MRPSVVEIFALEINLCSIFLTKTSCKIEGTWTTHIVSQEFVKLALEVFAFDDGKIGFLQSLDVGLQDIGHEGTAKLAVKTIGINMERSHKSLLLKRYMILGKQGCNS